MILNNTSFNLKTFQQLDVADLYQILRLRAAVFVFEQNCAYLDLDDEDQAALHLFHRTENQEIIAYARLLQPQQCQGKHCSIGRVVVQEDKRHLKLGKSLMQAAILACHENFPNTTIQISAQTYLTGFYQDLGFVNTGHFYLEDDIPHQEMIYQG